MGKEKGNWKENLLCKPSYSPFCPKFRFLPKLTSSDVATTQAEGSDIGPAYAVLSENTDPSPDEIRAFPYESKML